MQDKTLVSVIMPCYNDGQYLEEAIRSVEEQTYANVELIIIDDGSDDVATQRVTKKLEEEGHRIIHTNHVGPSAARNIGIDKAKGELILPLDADDKIDATYIEKAVAVFEQDETVGAVYCYADLFGERSGRWELPDYSFEAMLLDNVVFVTTVFRKSDWKGVGGFSEKMKYGMEDYDFFLSLLSKNKKFIQIPEILFHYRIKPTSRTTKFQNYCERMKLTYRQIFDNHKEFYLQNAETIIPILRDALIDQIYLRQFYERRAQAIEKIKKIPFLGNVLLKIYRVIIKKSEERKR